MSSGIRSDREFSRIVNSVIYLRKAIMRIPAASTTRPKTKTDHWTFRYTSSLLTAYKNGTDPLAKRTSGLDPRARPPDPCSSRTDR
jgi:hypothetical protein